MSSLPTKMRMNGLTAPAASSTRAAMPGCCWSSSASASRTVLRGDVDIGVAAGQGAQDAGDMDAGHYLVSARRSGWARTARSGRARRPGSRAAARTGRCVARRRCADRRTRRARRRSVRSPCDEAEGDRRGDPPMAPTTGPSTPASAQRRRVAGLLEQAAVAGDARRADQHVAAVAQRGGDHVVAAVRDGPVGDGELRRRIVARVDEQVGVLGVLGGVLGAPPPREAARACRRATTTRPASRRGLRSGRGARR